MALSISAVVLLAGVVALLLRSGSLRPWPALTTALFGFFLASTGLAAPINSAARCITALIGQIDF
ncbi:hypothetical protein [Streptomyces sp. NPDC090026]|uniref:hypothetical protein n=1 Tax=Streptomyces sp. NPDC090026 TaxID=3365923 RepID=UPI003814DC5E